MSFEKRVFVALGLCGAIWILFSLLMPPPPPPVEVASDVSEVGDEGGGSQESSATPEGAKKEAGANSGAPAEAAPASDIEVAKHDVANNWLRLAVSNRSPGKGGVVEGITLLSPQFAGHSTATDTFELGGSATLEVSFADAETDFRIPANTRFEVRESSSTSVVLAHSDANVEVLERLELLEGYEGKLVVTVTNKTEQEQRHRMHLRTQVGVGESSRYNIKRGLCQTSEDLEYEDAGDVEDGAIKYKGSIKWGGVDSKYFAMLLAPEQPFAECEMALSDDGSYLVSRIAPEVQTLQPGESKEYVVGLYIGAKELERLAAFSAVALDEGHGLEGAIDWGMLGAVSETLGRLLLTLMRFFQGYVGMWGLAIVLVTIVIKTLTLPLTLKQMSSMKAMKRIQPEIARLKEKYGDDRVKQGQEMQALFSREGVSPLAGCLPLVVQMPIWFALYSMLGAAVELVHEPFLWLPDLTKQDPYYALPLALGAMMVVQNRLMPNTSGDETQAKMMRWLMPAVFTAFMLFLPSGLGVYIFVNVVLSVIQSAIQLRTKNEEPQAEKKK